MKTILILVTWMAGMLCAPAALDSIPASSNVGNAEYPQIAPDRCVTFRLKAPKAQQVQLHGSRMADVASQPARPGSAAFP